jgi:hypothetical protein
MERKTRSALVSGSLPPVFEATPSKPREVQQKSAGSGSFRKQPLYKCDSPMKMVRDEGAIGWIRKFTVGAMAQPAKIGFGSWGKPLRHVGEALSRLFGPGRAQLRCDVFVLRVRQLPSRRGRSRRFPTKRRYDVKMRMVNGLAAAESVI